jgi:hypothetical protein
MGVAEESLAQAAPAAKPLEQKTCKRCGASKPVSDYYAHDRMAGGRLHQCKACVKAGVKHNYHANRERYRQYDAARPPRVVPIEVRRAQFAARRALRDGVIAQKDSCEKCGGTDTVQMHHHDYSKPLDVEFLCIGCHTTEHWQKPDTYSENRRAEDSK